MDVKLVVNVGGTDIQFVTGNPGATCRQLINMRDLRAVHELLLEGGTAWGFSEAPAGERPGRLAQGDIPDSTDDAPWQICTPKVDAALAWIEENGHKLVGALVFATLRENSDTFSDEPVASGPLVAERLRQWAQLRAGPATVWGAATVWDPLRCNEMPANFVWVNYLIGEELLEGERADDQDMRRVAIIRIDRAVSIFAGPGEPSNRSKLLIAVELVGGISRVGEVVAAAVDRFFSGYRIENIVPPLRGGHTTTVAPLPGPPAAESYRRRTQIDRLLDRGDVAGVRGALSGLGKKRAPWGDSLLAACEVLDGIPTSRKKVLRPDVQCSQELEAAVDAVAGPAAPSAFLVAVRAETALRGGRILDGLAWTGSFMDVAEVCALGQLSHVTPVANTALYTIPGLDTKWLTKIPATRVYPAFERQGRGDRYRPVTAGHPDSALVEFLEDQKAPSASTIRKVLFSWAPPVRGGGLRPIDHRNTAVHAPMVAGGLLPAIENSLRQAGLWTKVPDTPEGALRTLPAEHIKAVLNALGVARPEQAFDKFIEAARAVVWGRTC